MTRRLWYIISWPSAILTILFGVLMLTIIPSWILQKWMIAKLSFVALLIIYHLKTHVFLNNYKEIKLKNLLFYENMERGTNSTFIYNNFVSNV